MEMSGKPLERLLCLTVTMLIHDTILSELRKMEASEQIHILYACESGSRAWGFPSSDSDYDIRFIYIRTKDWYLSIDDKRDTIEQLINESLDISGWDIRKALKLFRKSNPPLLEWLQSPIIYIEEHDIARQLRSLSSEFFSSRALLHHYLSMAKGNYREYLQGEQVRAKKYLYVLRPILACKWIEENGTVPPMEFSKLVDSHIPDGLLVQAIHELLCKKKSEGELNLIPRVDIINSSKMNWGIFPSIVAQ